MATDAVPDPVLDVLSDLSPAAVAGAIDAQRHAFLRFARAHAPHADGVEYHEEAELAWVRSGKPSAGANYVYRTKWPADLAPAEIRERVRRMIAFYGERALPFSWQVGPLTAPPDLSRYLEACGFRLEESDDWYALDLATLPAPPTSPDPAAPVTPDTEITLVEGAVDHEAWIETLSAGVFDSGVLPDDQRDRVLAVWRGMGYGEPQRLYLARQHGEPVATALVFSGGGVAGLYQVQTASRARGQGVGTAIVLRALLGAAEAGYRVAVLSSTEMGLPIYRRLGFHPFATYRTYVYDGGSREDSVITEWSS